MAVKKKVVEAKVEKVKYTCLCCGSEKTKDKFFKSKWSEVWTYSDKVVLVCKDCINKRFDTLSNRYGSEKTALVMCCYILDVPFYNTLYESITQNNSIFSVGLYLRQLQLGQYQFKTFLNTLLEGELDKTEQEVREEVESKWSKADKQNMNFVLSVVGYDPFDDCGMTQNDRKYCFNILASYCDTDGIREDGHKIQSVIQMTQSHLQCRKLDELINAELLEVHPNDKRVKELTATKKQLSDSIIKSAQDNNISSATNKNLKAGVNTLSAKMKEMADDGYEQIKVNLFDIKTVGAIKQIADISNRSIIEQITLDTNDYTQIIAEQREMIEKFRNSSEIFEEENRMLKNKISDIESTKKRR